MKINILYLAITALFITSGCQKKIQNASLIQTRTDSLTNTIIKIDTLVNIDNKLKVDTLAKIENKLKVEDFTLSIEPKIFNNSTMGKAKVVIANNTKEHILVGEVYFIEFYEENIWKRLDINKNITFDAIGHNIKAFSSREFEVNLKIKPYNYKTGRYRISKDGHFTSNKKRFVISTEFIVE